VTEIKNRKKSEEELDLCRKESERQQVEWENERQRASDSMQQQKLELSEKAVKFVESEIMALNTTMLQLGRITFF
jgi:hypothetical protein